MQTVFPCAGPEARFPPTGNSWTDAHSSELDRDVCVRLLHSHNIGRVIYTNAALPAVDAVNYTVESEVIYFQAPDDSILASRVPGYILAFLVDDLDRQSPAGWSILATGRCYVESNLSKIKSVMPALDLVDVGARLSHPGDQADLAVRSYFPQQRRALGVVKRARLSSLFASGNARSGPSAPQRRSHLVRGFALTSAVLSALLGVILSYWLTDFVRSSNLAHAKDSAAYSMRVAVGTMDVKSAGPTTITAAQYVESTKLLRSMVASGKYTGATAWSHSRTIAYAVEKSRIGKAEPYRPQVIEALQGRLVSAVVNRTDPAIPDPTEQSSLRTYGPLLETFVPVRIGGNFAAVVQFYQRWRPVQQAIASQTLRVVLLIAGGIGLLWLGLLRIVMAASRRLTAQARENWRLATHDPLTGLPNRSLLRDRVDRALSANTRSDKHLGLLLLDLDRFKDVNDMLGHDCGDVLLRQVGPRIIEQLRDGDSIARLGGDEFVVLLPEVPDLSAASQIAERIRGVLSQPFVLDPDSHRGRQHRHRACARPRRPVR